MLQLEKLLDVVRRGLRREDSLSINYHSRTVVLGGSNPQDLRDRERDLDQNHHQLQNPLQQGIGGEELVEVIHGDQDLDLDLNHQEDHQHHHVGAQQEEVVEEEEEEEEGPTSY